HAPRSLRDHRFLLGGDRPRAVREMLDRGCVAVLGHQGMERLHEMPGRTVDPRLVARMDVQAGAASPFLAAPSELALDDALGAEGDLDDSVQVLTRRRHEDAAALRECR